MGSVLKIQRGGEEAQVTYAKYNYTTTYSDQKASSETRAFVSGGGSVVYAARGHYLDQTRGLFSMDFTQITASSFNTNLYSSFALTAPLSTNNRTGYFSSVYEYTSYQYINGNNWVCGYLHTVVTSHVVGSLVGYVAGKLGDYPTDGPHTDGYYYKLLVTS